MAWNSETYDLAVLKRTVDYLERGGDVDWVPSTELPQWATSDAAVPMGTVHQGDGPVLVLDGPWFGLRVVQLVITAHGRRWRFATLRLPQLSRPPMPSLAHRLGANERLPVHGRRRRRRRQQAS